MTTSQTWQRVGMGLVGWALFASGCATATDVRGSARVTGPGPALLVTGPLEILHMSVDQEGAPRFSRADAATGDCRTAAPLAWTGETDLTLRAGEAVCVQVKGEARVSWHARAVPATAAPLPSGLPPATVPSALAAR